MAAARREPVSLRLPATSANLGPGFDAAALALALFLEVDARPSDRFTIEASGRQPELCGALEGNLILDTYRELWARYALQSTPDIPSLSGREPQPLALRIRNGIPLGMGCGSSAAARLAAAALVSHFAGLGWSRARLLAEAAALEHHPDNAAACCLGGFVVAGYAPAAGLDPVEPRAVHAVSFVPPLSWHALLVLPEQPLATAASRAALPAQYHRAAGVENLQNLALLVAAFARGDAALLASATRDRLHQPYRSAACPLLPRLLPLAGAEGILSVTLSGAGSGVLLLLPSDAAVAGARVRVAALAGGGPEPLAIAEYIPCALSSAAAQLGDAPAAA